MQACIHTFVVFKCLKPQKSFWPGINLYIALGKIPQKFFSFGWVFVSLQCRQKNAPIWNITTWKNYQIGSGSSTTCDVIPRVLLWALWSTTRSTKMPDDCVVFGYNNTPNRGKGIGLHQVHFYGAEERQKRKTRKMWVDFVQLKRAYWKPTKYSVLCSRHFREDHFTGTFLDLTGPQSSTKIAKRWS